MLRRLFLLISAASVLVTMIGCSDNKPFCVSPTDGITSASSQPGYASDGIWPDQRQIVTLSKGYNNLTYCFALTNWHNTSQSSNYISCKRQTTASFEATSWPQPWNWRDELAFTPVWGGLASGCHTPLSNMHSFLFVINSANNKIMYKREISPSSGGWQAWKQIKESVAVAVKPPLYTGHMGSGVITVFAIDYATGKIRAFQKEATVGGDENQWSTYLIGDIAVKNFCVVSTDDICIIYAATSNALYRTSVAKPKVFTKIGPSTFACTGDLRITNGGLVVAQKTSGIYVVNSTSETQITSDCPKHFDVASAGSSSSSEAWLMYLTGSGTNTSIKLLNKNTSGAWSLVTTGSYPNQSFHPVDQMCIKAYNYPCDNRVVFFGNFDNNNLAPPAGSRPGYFDVWQLYKTIDWTGHWLNLGNQYFYY